MSDDGYIAYILTNIVHKITFFRIQNFYKKQPHRFAGGFSSGPVPRSRFADVIYFIIFRARTKRAALPAEEKFIIIGIWKS
jgi:hypothetical protein